jgi:hypothetical protein
MTHEITNGSRAQVWHGTAKHTSGGLTKSDLMMNKHGRIVSRKKHTIAKREKRLVKAGYVTKKGHFGFIKKGSKTMRKSKKMRGGVGAPMEGPVVGAQMEGPVVGNSMGGARRHSKKMRGGLPLSPSSYNGQGVGTSGVALQFVAGNAN